MLECRRSNSSFQLFFSLPRCFLRRPGLRFPHSIPTPHPGRDQGSLQGCIGHHRRRFLFRCMRVPTLELHAIDARTIAAPSLHIFPLRESLGELARSPPADTLVPKQTCRDVTAHSSIIHFVQNREFLLVPQPSLVRGTARERSCPSLSRGGQAFYGAAKVRTT